MTEALKYTIVSYLILVLFAAVQFSAVHASEYVASSVDPSVVRVFVTKDGRKITGSGFIVNKKGYVATNNHVVQPGVKHDWKIYVVESGADPEARREAKLVKAFPGEDLAVLHVEGLDRPAVLFGAGSGQLGKGTPVYAFGFPGAGDRLGPIQESSIATGILSRSFAGAWSKTGPSIRILQHTVPTNPGGSGGPLVDACGHVVGINSQREVRMIGGPGGVTLVTDPIQGVFFASHVSSLLGKLDGMGISFSRTWGVCKSMLGFATVNLHYYLAAVASTLVLMAAWLMVYKPQPAVRIVVRCQDMAQDCVNAVTRAMRRVRHLGGKLVVQISNTRQSEAGQAAWMMAGMGPDGQPVNLTISGDELCEAGGEIIIGSDKARGGKVISSASVSPHHALIVSLEDNGVGLLDLNSDAGTFINGEKLAPFADPVPLLPDSKNQFR